MLPKKERLTREDFNRFFSAGKRTHFPDFQLIYAPYTTLHVSVVVSKKISKRAVVRNKLRRRVYDLVRRYRDSEGVTGVYIFIIKSDALKKSFGALQTDVTKALQKVKHIHN